MGMLAGQVDGVIGVDTHRDSLAAAVIDPLGGIITHTSAPATDAGYQKLLEIRSSAGGGPAVLGARGHRQLRRRHG